MNNKIGALNPDVMGIIGENISENMMENCKEIVDNIEKQTIEILEAHKSYMIKIAKLLLKKETITYQEIKSIVPKKLCNSCIIKI